MWDCSNSTASTLELLQSWTTPLILIVNIQPSQEKHTENYSWQTRIGHVWAGSMTSQHATFAFVVLHDDVIKWKHFPRNWPFVREIHRSPVNFPHKGHWRGALMFSLVYAWINDWVNNREAGHLRRQHGHYDVIVMACHGMIYFSVQQWNSTMLRHFCLPSFTLICPGKEQLLFWSVLKATEVEVKGILVIYRSINDIHIINNSASKKAIQVIRPAYVNIIIYRIFVDPWTTTLAVAAKQPFL